MPERLGQMVRQEIPGLPEPMGPQATPVQQEMPGWPERTVLQVTLDPQEIREIRGQHPRRQDRPAVLAIPDLPATHQPRLAQLVPRETVGQRATLRLRLVPPDPPGIPAQQEMQAQKRARQVLLVVKAQPEIPGRKE